jgi:hypothetical protein
VATSFRVLYVCAWGRSGTTLVDNVLNAYPKVFSAGEARYLWSRGILGKRDCGCGRRLLDCPVWSQVQVAAFGSDPPDPKHVVDLQRRVSRTRNTLRLARGRLSADAVEFGNLLSRLYAGIASVTGATVIVDSSKMPADAAVLGWQADLDVSLLHMVRDARAVAHSWSRAKAHRDRDALMAQHSPSRSTTNWMVWNGATELLRRRYGERYLRLRYEDLVAHPRDRINDILRFMDLTPGPGPFLDERHARLPVNHTVSGNPRRFGSGETSIAPDDAWRSEQAGSAKLVSSVLGLPLLMRYHYPLVPSSPAPTEAVESD